jgi:ferritin-like metal-binding protein YciE
MVSSTNSSASIENKTQMQISERISLVESLKLVYAAEQQWLTVLPIIQLAVASDDLLELLEKFQKDVREHLARLESTFELLQAEVAITDNKDMEYLIDECYDIIDVTPRHSFIRDAGLIVGMQQAQQYQITALTSLLAQALELSDEKIVNLIKIIIHSKQMEEEQLAMADAGTMLDEIV